MTIDWTLDERETADWLDRKTIKGVRARCDMKKQAEDFGARHGYDIAIYGADKTLLEIVKRGE